MNRSAVINVVGLSARLARSLPCLAKWASGLRPIQPAFPAVTCTAQSNYVTGAAPTQHGIVGNGWYNRELAEVQFWKQPDQIVQHEKLWESLRRQNPEFTCAKLFWWYNMYSAVDYSITPRPAYPADGRKIFDIYTHPFSLRTEIKKDLGEFPFFGFWGPAAGVNTPQGSRDCVSRWIAESAKWVERRHQPTLSLVYLPHLDYNFQRWGAEDPRLKQDLEEINAILADLIEFFQKRGVQVIILSEYGITTVDRPVHLNRLFRDQGWIAIKEELGLERLDCGASKAFAVADHQLAHVYINDQHLLPQIKAALQTCPGVDRVLDGEEKRAAGIAHSRAGDLVAVADARSWFSYYYWNDDSVAPDFARCVDIHRKPGYDPVELFLDPELRWPKVKIFQRLLKKRLGFRMLMDVIPLRADLVKGSHGRTPESVEDYPVLVMEDPARLENEEPVVPPTRLRGLIEKSVLG